LVKVEPRDSKNAELHVRKLEGFKRTEIPRGFLFDNRLPNRNRYDSKRQRNNMILTRDLIYSVQGVNGGWNNAQLKLMCVEFPISHGWIDRIANRSIDEEVFAKVQALAGVKKKSKRKEILNGQDLLL